MQAKIEAHGGKPAIVAPTLAYATVEDVLVICHGYEGPSASEWRMLLHRLSMNDFRVILVSTRGGAPSAAQCEQIVALWRDFPARTPRACILTESLGMRMWHLPRHWLSTHDVQTMGFDADREAARFLESRATPMQLRELRAHLHRALEPGSGVYAPIS